MQKEIRLKYSWIKQRRSDVLEFLETNYGIEKNTTSKAKIEDDLGITGEDASELIQKFGQHFHVDMSEVNFEKYFHDEGTDPGWIGAIVIKIFLIPFALLVLPFSWVKFKEMIMYDPFLNNFPQKEDLTIGDLITSTFTHKFTLQKDVLIKLV